jgi:hypothetical protein
LNKASEQKPLSLNYGGYCLKTIGRTAKELYPVHNGTYCWENIEIPLMKKKVLIDELGVPKLL